MTDCANNKYFKFKFIKEGDIKSNKAERESARVEEGTALCPLLFLSGGPMHLSPSSPKLSKQTVEIDHSRY